MDSSIDGLESNLLEITSLIVAEEDVGDVLKDVTFLKLRHDMDVRLQAEYDTLFDEIRGNIFKVSTEDVPILVYL